MDRCCLDILSARYAVGRDLRVQFRCQRQPLYALLFIVKFAASCVRLPQFVPRKSAGLTAAFRETPWNCSLGRDHLKPNRLPRVRHHRGMGLSNIRMAAEQWLCAALFFVLAAAPTYGSYNYQRDSIQSVVSDTISVRNMPVGPGWSDPVEVQLKINGMERAPSKNDARRWETIIEELMDSDDDRNVEYEVDIRKVKNVDTLHTFSAPFH